MAAKARTFPGWSVVEDVLDLLAGLLDVGADLVGLPLGLEPLVVGHFAGGFLGLAAKVLGHVAGLVIGTHLLPPDRGLTVGGIRCLSLTQARSVTHLDVDQRWRI